MRHVVFATALAITQLAAVCCTYGQEPAQTRSDSRMDYMRQMIESMEVRPLQAGAEVAKQFDPNAILRFGDATRETADGSIWKLGAARPQAIVAMEFTRGADAPQVNYEFLCLTNQRFELHTQQGWNWRPVGSAIEFQRFADVISPSESPVFRLRQMKMLARRFSATERYNGEEFRLRMMPQPVDQYVIEDGERNHSGAIFVFANGTNPEVLLLLESDDSGWRYALARLCGAEPTVKLGDRVVWNKPSMEEVGKGWQLDYTGDAHWVEPSALSTGRGSTDQ